MVRVFLRTVPSQETPPANNALRGGEKMKMATVLFSIVNNTSTQPNVKVVLQEREYIKVSVFKIIACLEMRTEHVLNVLSN